MNSHDTTDHAAIGSAFTWKALIATIAIVVIHPHHPLVKTTEFLLYILKIIYFGFTRPWRLP